MGALPPNRQLKVIGAECAVGDFLVFFQDKGEAAVVANSAHPLPSYAHAEDYAQSVARTRIGRRVWIVQVNAEFECKAQVIAKGK